MTAESTTGFWPVTAKDWATLGQGVAALLALFSAAGWFLFAGEAVQRVNVDHKVENRRLDAYWTWVRVESHLENVGNVKVRIDHSFGTVRRILPLEPEFVQSLRSGYSLMGEKEREVRWREIGTPHESNPALWLNPKEKDYIVHEFMVPSGLQSLEVYTSFRSGDRRRLRYRKSTIYDLK